jgi:plastocyanin
MKFAMMVAAAMGLTLTLGGCADGPAVAGEGGSGQPSVTPTGNVVEVIMTSGRGEVFDPGHITVKQGDVLRFKLEMGVHNASWPADQNPAGVNLPEATPYLQIPGQTYDVLIEMPPGEYTFHCDPHAVLGMIGKLTVEA